jgi:hypothetical protein
MANTEDQAREATRPQPFTLYAAQGRIYARNSDEKLIDLGPVTREDSGGFCYLLEGNKQSGSGFFTEEAVLADIAEHLRFLWLDGQFTAIADAREGGDVNLEGASRLDIVLDELAPGEREFDATV